MLYLLCAVVGVVLFRTFRLPSVLAYLVVGMVIGPHAFGVVDNNTSVQHLAEFGIVFLMFVIGLEFSLQRMKRNARYVFALGGGQLGLSLALLAACSAAVYALWPQAWPLDGAASFALAAAVAMSSTAVVGRMMSELQELDSDHGRRVMGVLLFQDLAVVPLLLLVPALGSQSEAPLQAIGMALLKATLLIATLLIAGPHLLRPWLRLVAKRNSDELFMLNVLSITLGLAWLTQRAELSLALGAFIAGMLIAETEYRHRVETEIRPFHDLLLGLFFVTVGMLLNWQILLQHWWLVPLVLLVILSLKFFVVILLVKLLKGTPGTALRSALYLASMGEFGIVLLGVMQQNALLPAPFYNIFIAAMVLSMLLAPLLVLFSSQIVLHIAKNEWLLQSLQLTSIARSSIRISQHVLICGYGRAGQNMAKLLAAEGIAYIALDTDPDRVRTAAAAGEHVAYGDATSLQALMAAGLARCATVAVTFVNRQASIRVLDHIRSHSPQAHVVVRSIDEHGLEALHKAGATVVVPEAIEGSLMLASQVLALQGVSMRKVIRIIQQQRERHYTLFRGYFHGQDDDDRDYEEEHLKSVHIPENSAWIGLSLAALNLDGYEVRIVSLRRSSGAVLTEPDSSLIVQAHDVVMLCGRSEALMLAEELLS